MAIAQTVTSHASTVAKTDSAVNALMTSSPAATRKELARLQSQGAREVEAERQRAVLYAGY